MGSLITLLAEQLIPNVNNFSLHLGLDSFLSVLSNAIGNAGWAVVLFTLIIKLALSPLDYVSRLKMKKNSVKMERMRPHIEKIQKQYAGRKDIINQKTMSLYKKEGYSMWGACLPQLVSFGLFFYIFAAFRSFADYNNTVFMNKLIDAYNTSGGNQAFVNEVYQSSKQSFLWIQNIWRPDTWVHIMPTATEFVNGSTGLQGVSGIDGDKYNNIMNCLQLPRGGKWNGFMILPFVAMGVSFFSQWVMRKQGQMETQMPGQPAGGGMTMKIMMYMFPIIFGVFAFSYSTAFTIYMISNSLFTVGISYLINWIVTIQVRNMKEKQKDDKKASYMR